MNKLNINLKIKRFFLVLSGYIVLTSICSPSVQAAAPLKSYDTSLTIAAIALNLSYPIHLFCSKNEKLYNRISYPGNSSETVWNHSLNLIDFAALSSELPLKHLFLAGAILIGIQTSTYRFCDTHGVSLVWAGLTGMLLHRLCIQKKFKWHLLLATLLNSATLVYYACNAPLQTNMAHLGGLAVGFGLSFLLPYKTVCVQRSG